MRFLSFNLWHGLSPSTFVAFKTLEPEGRRHLREQLQIETIDKLKPDVAMFQEVNPVLKRTRALAQGLSMESVYQPDLAGLKLFGFGFPANLHSGLVTMAQKKWGLKKLEGISLTRPGVRLVHGWASWQLQEERFALFSEVMLPRWGRVLVVNTHLHWGLELTPELSNELAQLSKRLDLSDSTVSELKERFAAGNQRRVEEVAVLLRGLQRYQNRYEVILLAGDLNATPSNEICNLLRELGFKDAWSQNHPQDTHEGNTFDSERNTANHLLQRDFPTSVVVEDLSFSTKIRSELMDLAKRQETRPRRIDYVWYKTKSIDLQVTRAQLVGLPDRDGFAPSDHFGVCVDLERVNA